MDIKLEKKTGWRAVFSKKSIPYLFCALLAVLVVWILVRENTSTLRVNTATITVSNVEEGEFNDYASLSGTVQPMTTMQLSPLESGVVERIVAEEGTSVKAGDVIALREKSKASQRMKEIAEAKLEILDGMNGGTLLLPYNEPLLSEVNCGLYVARNSSLSDFSLDNTDGYSYSFKSANARVDGITFFDKREHLLYNLAYAISVAQMLGLSNDEIIKGVKAITNKNLRQRLLVMKDFTIFDDSYNASLESISADFDFLHSLGTPTGAFLGDVLELGDKTEYVHKEIGRLAVRSGIERLYLYGEYANYIAEGAMLEGMSEKSIFINTDIANPHASVKQIRKNHVFGETILFKASHKLRLDKIADIIEKEERINNDG